jgi:hypothetical protein
VSPADLIRQILRSQRDRCRDLERQASAVAAVCDDPEQRLVAQVVATAHDCAANVYASALQTFEDAVAQVASGASPEPAPPVLSLVPPPRRTAFTDAPGGGVCQCLNPASPLVCEDCPESR